MIEEIRNERIKKLELLKEYGMDPYPSKTGSTHSIAQALEAFDNLVHDATHVVLAGRIMTMRGQGAILFLDIFDGSGRIQIVLKEDVMAPELFDLFKRAVDSGDFVRFEGELFVTQKGQQSLLATSWHMLTKTLLPLPDKFHGLQDEDERFRKRYLDILTRPELREVFIRKECFWDTTRSFLKRAGFLEVETPTLELTTGGAEARPFKTHHNDFDIDVFLRISVGELWQKRLMAAGFTKIFEIGRTYRNEGSSPNHLQEFTNMEFYYAYADYEDGMRLVEDLYRTIAISVYGTTQFTRRGHTFDFADAWKRIDYCEEVERQTGLNPITASDEAMRTYLHAEGVSYEGTNRERLVDTLWKHCRKNIAGPVFLVNHPKLISPLAKELPDDPERTQRFQPIIAGTEVGNGYSELNNPEEQRARFALQQSMLERGDEEAMMTDAAFVEMLDHGMPPTCGFGFGERLFAILEDKPIRETTLFPLMRPK